MRESGILMHITSLPSPGGIGTLGAEAYAFADFLYAAGMRIWQVLPIGPTGYGESPYQSASTFAGNPLLIDMRLLRESGLLSGTDDDDFVPASDDKTDYDAVRQNKTALLRRAYRESADKIAGEIADFRSRNSWVDDFALFTAVKEHFGNIMWSKWPDEGIRLRRSESVAEYRKKLKDDIGFHVFVQYLFRKQWFDLKKYCGDHDICLFGDMPIYVAEDSADAWTHPEVFQLDKSRIPKAVAGVPPDYFSADGQLWGNPLYRWTYLRLHGYDWWVERMRGMAELYDMIRIDHFIGFANFYSVKYGMPNARIGRWIKGPGKYLFKRLKEAVPNLNVIAEDLGCVNRRVQRLLDWCGYPGMRVMSFGFGSGKENRHAPGCYPANSVAYTGTHDNDTVLGWAEKADQNTLEDAMHQLGFSEISEAPEAFVKALFASNSDRVIVPMQDLLGLGSDARMNLPGTIGGNWLWRMKPGCLTTDLVLRLIGLNKSSGRG